MGLEDLVVRVNLKALSPTKATSTHQLSKVTIKVNDSKPKINVIATTQAIKFPTSQFFTFTTAQQQDSSSL